MFGTKHVADISFDLFNLCILITSSYVIMGSNNYRCELDKMKMRKNSPGFFLLTYPFSFFLPHFFFFFLLLLHSFNIKDCSLGLWILLLRSICQLAYIKRFANFTKLKFLLKAHRHKNDDDIMKATKKKKKKKRKKPNERTSWITQILRLVPLFI